MLRILAVAAGVAAFPGFKQWAFAGSHVPGVVAQIKPAAYQPLFFASPEFALLECLTDIIIPADGTPGAREAGVSEFIDLMASRDEDLQHEFRSGMNWLDARSRKRHGKLFLALSPDDQVEVLTPLAYKAKHNRGDEPGRKFFNRVREYTVMGFYTSEIGLKELDFPGLQFYADSPACPHKDDPEHRHLPPPKW